MSESQEFKATPSAISHYYDSNTTHFLRFGGSGDAAAIHRAIWAPQVQNKTQAFLYLNQMVADAILPLLNDDPSTTHVLDLGCGVGGTSTWLAQTLNVRATGITLSSEQVRLAQTRAQRLGLSDKVAFLCGDFSNPPPLPRVQAAFAIEAFVHVAEVSSFFAMAARQILQGGRLIICDDFLNPPHTPKALRWVERFKRGWHLNSLLPADAVVGLAETAGFRLVHEHDLSAWVRPFSPAQLWLTATVTRIPLPWAYWQNLSGGTALQVCLKKGWTAYRVMVWERV